MSGGFSKPSGSQLGMSSLLLGVCDKKGALVYAGSVGTGFNDKTLRDLYKRLKPLEVSESPFAPSRELEKNAVWVQPKLVVEVAFAEWTSSGSVRHATYCGLRSDKPAASVMRESAASPPVSEAGARTPTAPALKVTNGERTIDKVSGATEEALVAYCVAAGDVMLPHLIGRPTSLVRAPAGGDGELFFQKHAEYARWQGMKRYPTEIHPDHPPMLSIGTAEGLLATAQWNMIEYPTQNALGTRYSEPDRMVFDIDPGEGVSWQDIQQAAQLVRGMLEHLGLKPFLKTSGGKGLHVVVPIEPDFEWDLVKELSKAVVAHMSKLLPDRFVVKSH